MHDAGQPGSAATGGLRAVSGHHPDQLSWLKSYDLPLHAPFLSTSQSPPVQAEGVSRYDEYAWSNTLPFIMACSCDTCIRIQYDARWPAAAAHFEFEYALLAQEAHVTGALHAINCAG